MPDFDVLCREERGGAGGGRVRIRHILPKGNSHRLTCRMPTPPPPSNSISSGRRYWNVWCISCWARLAPLPFIFESGFGGHTTATTNQMNETRKCDPNEDNSTLEGILQSVINKDRQKFWIEHSCRLTGKPSVRVEQLVCHCVCLLFQNFCRSLIINRFHAL